MERNTRQRAAIEAAFRRAKRPLGPTEVLELAREDVERLGIATVYRTIKSLIDDGWLTAVGLPGEPDRYEPAGLAHHHHFRCQSCDRVFDLKGCVEGLKKLVPKSFRLESHELILVGRCNQCAA